jgi:hypothetical protein
MNGELYHALAEAYIRTHVFALRLVSDVSDQQLRKWLGPSAPPMAFHIWHLARWGDLTAAVLGEAQTQIWQAEWLAEHWGWPSTQLGFGETGMEMGDEIAADLRFPPKAALLDYVERAFAAANDAVNAAAEKGVITVEMDQLAVEYFGRDSTVPQVILRELRHDNRHVGMIESLRGLLGLS